MAPKSEQPAFCFYLLFDNFGANALLERIRMLLDMSKVMLLLINQMKELPKKLESLTSDLDKIIIARLKGRPSKPVLLLRSQSASLPTSKVP